MAWKRKKLQLKMTSKLSAVTLLISVFLSLPADAHRKEVPVTEIEWNAQTDKWEVTHRLSAHDFEEALGAGVDVYSLDSNELNEKAASYVQSNFQIAGFMFLRFVGAELEDDTVWAYYELWGRDQTIIVSSRLLTEIDATAATLVNVRTGETVDSYVFDSDAGLKALKLRRPVLN